MRKFQSDCSLVNYKISEKANTVKQCIEKCKTYAICGSALFVKPRSITTLDLNKLYTKVIDSENWVSINEPETLLKYYRQINKEKRKEKMIEPENDDDFQHFSQVNSSAIKGVRYVSGFCYIYSDQIGTGETVKCSQSHLTFTYEQIDCIEDQKCVDKRPRKQCTRGKCGRTCNECMNVFISFISKVDETKYVFSQYHSYPERMCGKVLLWTFGSRQSSEVCIYFYKININSNLSPF